MGRKRRTETKVQSGDEIKKTEEQEMQEEARKVMEKQQKIMKEKMEKAMKEINAVCQKYGVTLQVAQNITLVPVQTQRR